MFVCTVKSLKYCLYCREGLTYYSHREAGATESFQFMFNLEFSLLNYICFGGEVKHRKESCMLKFTL